MPRSILDYTDEITRKTLPAFGPRAACREQRNAAGEAVMTRVHG